MLLFKEVSCKLIDHTCSRVGQIRVDWILMMLWLEATQPMIIPIHDPFGNLWRHKFYHFDNFVGLCLDAPERVIFLTVYNPESTKGC